MRQKNSIAKIHNQRKETGGQKAMGNLPGLKKTPTSVTVPSYDQRNIFHLVSPSAHLCLG